MTEAQAATVALWIAHTYVLDAAESTPYLDITGPERRVGKSRLLEVLALLTREPIETANISEAALFRIVSEKAPTLLFDEVDSLFGGRAKDKEDLRGLLNAGHRRGAVAYRMVGEGSKMRPEPFAVFCPKAFAGIGDRLPDTVADRSIRIGLKRKTRSETAARFRRREADGGAAPIREHLSKWAENHVDTLSTARPVLPDELDDRAQDSWEILLAIAELAGAQWRGVANQAAVSLSGHRQEEESRGIHLLWLIRAAFDQPGRGDRIATTDLIGSVATADESHFEDWWNVKDGKPEKNASQRLARLLRHYEIRSKQLKIDGRNQRGFERDWFEDAWTRYPPPDSEPATPATSRVESETPPATSNATTPLRSGSVAEGVTPSEPSGEPHVAGVTPLGRDDGAALSDAEIAAVFERYPDFDRADWPESERRRFAASCLATEARATSKVNSQREEER
jgi:hypothetical protein